MKIYLVFLALSIVFVTAIFFKVDYDKVDVLQSTVKRQVEDSASGAVYCIDETAYAEGYIKFVDEKVIAYVQNTLPANYDATITIFDDTMRTYENDIATGGAIGITYPYTYTDENGYSTVVHSPSVQITAIVKTDDLYRLPFLEKTEIARSTMYTWEERKKDETSLFNWF